ncbi:MAG: hypothetical protein GY782_05895, partial [Gammaproteobacteria bacterium]|nr:hypothetical protein [Gammaproteobacteria bacterium]
SNASHQPHAIYDMLNDLNLTKELGNYHVSHVQITVLMQIAGALRAKRFNIRLGWPNSCSLKYDEHDAILRKMLTLSGLEPALISENQEALIAETA